MGKNGYEEAHFEDGQLLFSLFAAQRRDPKQITISDLTGIAAQDIQIAKSAVYSSEYKQKSNFNFSIYSLEVIQEINLVQPQAPYSL